MSIDTAAYELGQEIELMGIFQRIYASSQTVYALWGGHFPRMDLLGAPERAPRGRWAVRRGSGRAIARVIRESEPQW